MTEKQMKKNMSNKKNSKIVRDLIKEWEKKQNYLIFLLNDLRINQVSGDLLVSRRENNIDNKDYYLSDIIEDLNQITEEMLSINL